MENYIDLMNFSGYSIGTGMLSIDEIIDNAKKSKRNYASLTDTNTLSGIPEFMSKCIKNNIKPIIGVTLSTTHEGKYLGEVTLISKNPKGFDDLKMLVSNLGVFNNDIHRTTELKDILDRSSNLLLIDGAKNSIIYNIEDQEEYLKIFTLIKQKMRQSFLGTIQTQVNDSKVTEITKRLFNAMTSTGNICKTNVFFSNNNRFSNKMDYPFQAEKMHKYSYLSKRLDKTNQLINSALIDKTDMFLPLSYLSTKLLKFVNSKTKDFYLSDSIVGKITTPNIFKEPEFYKASDDTLGEIMVRQWEAFKETLDPSKHQIYKKQMEIELNLFEKLGFSDYFVVINEMAKIAREAGQILAIRGSGAASLVVHMLGLSQIDPIEHKLMFGRFMNEGRDEAPDLDVETSNNIEMIEFFKELYGSENIANLMSFGTLKNANVTTNFVIEALRKYSDQSFEFQQKVNRVENEIKKKLHWYNNTKNVKTPKLSDFLNPKDPNKDYNNWVSDYKKDKDLKYILDSALRLEGQIINKQKSIGTIILSNVPIKTISSTFDNNDSEGSKLIIEVSKNYIQKMGHLKMDVLSSLILKKINETAKLANVNVNDLVKNMNDPSVYDAISKGHIIHINQLASRMQLQEDLDRNPKLRQGIGALMSMEIQPKNFQELTAIMALIRMGEENEEGDKPEQYQKYIEGKRNPSSITYKHPRLESVLSSTYGAIIFEEQIMRITQVIAGFNDTEADYLRGLIKKKKVKEFEDMKPRFIQGSLDSGIELSVAEDIYTDIEGKMGQYQFNEAHACVYASMAYQQMYFKLNHPAEFYSVHYEEDDVRFYEKEIVELGFFVQRPDINNSMDFDQTIYKVGREHNEQKIIDFSLNRIITDSKVLNDILVERDSYGYFENLLDYAERVLPIYTGCHLMSSEMTNNSKINRFIKDTKNLIKVGAFDKCPLVDNGGIEYIRSLMLENIDLVVKFASNINMDYTVELAQPKVVLSLQELKDTENNFLVVSPLLIKDRIENKVLHQKKNTKSIFIR